MTLLEYISAWPQRFDWHDSHCAHFALGWAQAATGRPALAAIPAVSGLRDWMRAVAAEGGMREMVSTRLRCQAVPADDAQPGDLVMLPGLLTGGALGIRLHAGGVAVLGHDGRVTVVPSKRAQCAWRLPEVLT
jgi:hypothetical protein